MMAARVLFHVQHVLGIGHVRRAALLSRAMAAAGLEVTVAAGGMPVAGIDFGAEVVFLPPARASDHGFGVLIDAEGRPIDEAWRVARAEQLLALAARVRPDILLIETYPFGRSALRFELEALLSQQHARRPRPLVACSVRDILMIKRNPARVLEMATTVRERFDLVLVHGDAAVIPFGATFARAAEIEDRLRYTGYVAAPWRPVAAEGDGRGEVVVSVGGGAVGLPLLRAAVAARALSSVSERPWRLLAGPDVVDEDVAALARAAPPGMMIERARPDFRDLLGRCVLSISQAGYNTVMDLLQARCRAVLVPFAQRAETEQRTRALLLAERGLVTVVDEETLSGASLARGVDAALAGPPPTGLGVAFDGAARCAEILLRRM